MPELHRRGQLARADFVVAALRTEQAQRCREIEHSERAKERRRERPRIELLQSAHLITQDGRVVDVEFLDLSQEGFKIRHSDDLLGGDLVTIVSVRGSRAQAVIKWVADRMAGGVFVGPPPLIPS